MNERFPDVKLDPATIQYLLEYWRAGLIDAPGGHPQRHRTANSAIVPQAGNVESIRTALYEFELWRARQGFTRPRQR